MSMLNPVFIRELQVLSRRGRLYALRSLVILVFAAYFWMSWRTLAYHPGLAQARFILRMGFVTRGVVTQVMWLQFLGMQLMAIIIFSGCLSDEVRRGTLDVLRTTPIRYWQLMHGKLFSRLWVLVNLILLSIPVYMVMLIWGGIEATFLWQCLACVSLTTLLAASWSACLSVLRLSPCAVVMGGILGMVGFHASSFLHRFHAELGQTLDKVNPFVLMQNLHKSLHVAQAKVKDDAIIDCFSVVGIACLLLWCVIFLCLVFWRSDNQGSRWRRFLSTSRAGRSRGARAIMWLELRSWRRVLLWNLVWLMGLGGLVTAMFVKGEASNWEGIDIMNFRDPAVNVLNYVILSSTLISAAYIIGHERDRRSWVGLLVTPLSHGQILRGKAWAVWACNIMGWLILMATIIGFWWSMGKIGTFMYPELHKWRLAVAIANMIGFVTFAIGLGAFFGVRMRTSMGALVGSFITFLFTYAIYSFGIQSAVNTWFIPWVQSKYGHPLMMKYVFGYQFSIAALQGFLGIGLLTWSRWRMRHYLFTH